jgi:hypothetical protein
MVGLDVDAAEGFGPTREYSLGYMSGNKNKIDPITASFVGRDVNLRRVTHVDGVDEMACT